MSTNDFNKYINSSEFKKLLARYEAVAEADELVYFDCDDLIDIAEAYHLRGELKKAADAANYCRKLYPKETAPFLFCVRMFLVDYGDVQKAKNLMADFREEDECLESVYVTAEIMVCEGKIEESEKYLSEKYVKYKEKIDNGTLYDDADDCDENDVPDMALDIAVMYCDHACFDIAEKWVKLSEGSHEDNALEYYDVWARIYMNRNEHAKAEEALNKILDIDPFNVNAWLMMSDTQFRSVRFADAMQSADYALAIDPEAADAYLSKGNCLYGMNKLEEAENCFEKFKELMPDDPVGDLLLATTYFCNRKVEKAYKYARNVVARIDDLPPQQWVDALRTCATIAAKCADMGLAEKCCALLQDMGIEDYEVEMVRGSIYMESMEIQMAVACFERAARLSDYDPGIIIRIGIICYDAQAYSYSYRLLHDTVELTKKDGYTTAPAPSLAFLAAVCRKLKKEDEYLYYLDYAAKLMPFDTTSVLADYFPEGTQPSEYLEIEKKRLNRC